MNQVVQGRVPEDGGITLTRIAFFVLGGIGFGMGLLVLLSGDWLPGAALGFFLGIPLWLALLKVPKKWMVRQAPAPAAENKELYHRYTPLDHAMLVAMVAVALLASWSSRWWPASLGVDRVILTIGMLLAVASNAYAWQLKASLKTRSAFIGGIVALVFGLMLAADREDMGSGMQIYGYTMAYAGLWILVRAALFEILARREPAVVGAAAPASAPAAAKPPKQNIYKSIYKTMPVTAGIVVALSAIFTLEVLCNIGRLGALLAPSMHTLVAFGALDHPLLLDGQQWYRLLSSALLHVNLIHLFFNCYALLLIGLMLENFVGRAWFFAIFVLGSIGGSLMSLAIDPPQEVSLGASGAIMALFAAALTTSFRRPDAAARKALQKWLLQVLVLSLLPVINFGGGRIDIAGHLGGAVTGGVLGLLLWAIWDEDTHKPRLEPLAMTVSLAGAAAFIYTSVPAAQHYPEYVADAKLHPEAVAQSAEDQRKAAQALADAQRGFEYEVGRGASQDYSQAFQWYQRGAQGGNGYAQGALSRLYTNGQGVARDYGQALAWAEKAAGQGDPFGEFEMGYLYGNGLGVKQDYAQGLAWFRKGAAQGNFNAEYALGQMYIMGFGVQKDPAQGFRWVSQAAQQGDAEVQEYLGYLYENGIGVKADPGEAMQWYGAAAKQGRSTAANALARLQQPNP